MAKQRGQKNKKNYFGPDEEAAVVRFLQSDDDKERNAIYNEYLKDPLNKMIESIIRKYKLYRKTESFEHLHSDTLSFLITKADKFNIDSGKRAYSYYGTICKRYLLGLLIKDEKSSKTTSSYEDFNMDYFENRDDLVEDKYNENVVNLEKLFESLVYSIKKEINGSSEINKKALTENEIKVGYGLIHLLVNWETTLFSMEGGVKYNKNSILETMRNYTGLTTKDIRLSMKRYKVIYKIIKEDGLSNGF